MFSAQAGAVIHTEDTKKNETACMLRVLQRQEFSTAGKFEWYDVPRTGEEGLLSWGDTK